MALTTARSSRNGAGWGHAQWRQGRVQAVSFFRPFAFLRLRIFRPSGVLIRVRNPCVRFRLLLLGWYVRFMVRPNPAIAVRGLLLALKNSVQYSPRGMRCQAVSGHGCTETPPGSCSSSTTSVLRKWLVLADTLVFHRCGQDVRKLSVV